MSDFNENVNIFSWVETFWKRSYSVIREENNLGSKYYVNLMLLFSVNVLNIDLISRIFCLYTESPSVEVGGATSDTATQ